MKTNLLIPGILLMLTAGLMNCSRDCDNKPAICSEAPPTNELCAAAFNRWFYNQEKNKCELIAYSGCSERGFETEPECEACKCR
ncbi:MAG: BPTI/Kunitz domain-containing protein [Weeksellaceae bacterium]|nr:BPTI/Kunitz domain-containing protein [Weeksellaceae bacterium]